MGRTAPVEAAAIAPWLVVARRALWSAQAGAVLATLGTIVQAVALAWSIDALFIAPARPGGAPSTSHLHLLLTALLAGTGLRAWASRQAERAAASFAATVLADLRRALVVAFTRPAALQQRDDAHALQATPPTPTQAAVEAQAQQDRAGGAGPAAATEASPSSPRGSSDVHLLVTGLDALEPYLAQYLPSRWRAAVLPLAVLAAVAAIDPWSAPLLLATAPLLPLFLALVGRAAEAESRRQWQSLAQLSAELLDAVQGLASLMLFGREGNVAARVAAASARFHHTSMRVLRVAFLSSLVLEAVATLSVALVAVTVGFRLLYGHLELAPALAVLILAPELYQPIRNLGASFHAAAPAREALARVATVLTTAGITGPVSRPTLDGEAEEAGAAGEAKRGRSGGGVVGDAGNWGPAPGGPGGPYGKANAAGSGAAPPLLSVRDLRVRYGDGTLALAGLSFDLAAGEHLVITGPSGAGKSTLLGVLSGLLPAPPNPGESTSGAATFPPAAPAAPAALARGPAPRRPAQALDPSLQDAPADPPPHTDLATPDPPTGGVVVTGSVCADGLPLARWPAKIWRRQLAWVPQNPVLLAATARENLLLAAPDATPAAQRAAAEEADAAGFLDHLPAGWETPLGERAGRLSGGQRQRLALARAFLRDARLLLLDEPTSHLDPTSAQRIRAAVERRRRAGVAVLEISHDPAACTGATHVLELGGPTTQLAAGTAAPAAELGLRGAAGAPTRDAAADPRIATSPAASPPASGPSPRSEANGGHPTGDDQGAELGSNPHVAVRHPHIESRRPEDQQRPVEATRQRDERADQPLAALLVPLRPLWPRFALAVLAAFATGAAALGLAATAAWLIAAAALAPSVAALAVAVVGVRFFGIARAVARYLERLASHDLTLRLLASLRTRVFGALAAASPLRLLDRRSGDTVGRLVADIELLEGFYTRSLAPPVVALLAVAAGIAVGAWQLPLATGLAGGILLAGAVLAAAVATRRARQSGLELVARRAELEAAATEGFQGLADLHVLGAVGPLRATLHLATEALGDATRKLATLRADASAVLLAASGLATTALLAVVATTGATGAPTLAAVRHQGSLPVEWAAPVWIAVATLTLLATLESLLALPAAVDRLAVSLPAAARVRALAPAAWEPAVPCSVTQRLGSAPTTAPTPLPTSVLPAPVTAAAGPILAPPRPSAADADPADPAGSTTAPTDTLEPTANRRRPAPPALRAEGITLAYGPREPAVFTGLDFAVAPGELVGVAGASGAGKSSLVALLAGFVAPTGGRLWLGQHEIGTLSPTNLRRHLTVLAQHPHCFAATLRDNLRLAAPAAGEAELAAALDAAGLSELVTRLPQGLDTRLGVHGSRLSGGERQRLAIAQVLLREAPILLLDEPTRHLDAAAEAQALDALLAHARGRTTLLISHRSAALARCPRILTLADGRFR